MDLTGHSATELLRLLAVRDVTAVEVVEAHVRAIEQRGRDLNAIAVPRYERALEEAAAADRLRARGRPAGPLAGLPLTVKESFDLTGTPTTAGAARLQRKPSGGDAAVVAALRNAGAAIMAKTNLGQLCWSVETSNPVYGRTSNPWDRSRTPGGSSGGEGAAISARLSPAGIGTDSGGSVRIPAHYCGIHALKPTSGRLSDSGTVDQQLVAFLPIVTNQPGVLARHVGDLRLIYELLAAAPEAAGTGINPVAGAETVDRAGRGNAGRGQESRRRYVIGYFTDGLYAPAAAIERAVAEAVGQLESAGMVVRPFRPPSLQLAKELYDAAFALDRGATLRALADGSQLDPLVEEALADLTEAPAPGRFGGGEPLLEACRAYRHDFTQALDAAEVDVLVCPPSGVTAHPHGMSPALEGMAFTCELFNLLGVPAGVVSISRVRPREEQARRRPGSPAERAAATAGLGSAGLPVGVQVAGRHWAETAVLDVMELLENRVRDTADYPAAPPIISGL
jgi:fatty acid amide hydrolase